MNKRIDKLIEKQLIKKRDKEMKVNTKVKIITRNDPGYGNVGKVVAKCKDNYGQIIYIVQFKTDWNYFTKKELKKVKQ